ncbi:MAG: ferrochelatase [Anaerolineales bacterium]|nr:MAG: ferrochelatase [Anaerolineales bacterium]
MSDAKGVLLLNLGSPDAPEEDALRVYLEEFLMDERVLDYPRPIRSVVVKQFILPKQPASSAEAYASIWWPEGSPLVVISQRVQQALQARTQLPVELGMRYGKPGARQALQALLDAGVRDIFAIPLFPHYAMSTIESAVVKTQEELHALDPGARLHVQPPYYDEPGYMKALVESARPHLQKDYGHLLFSYHGLPERHIRKSDPTGAHCLRSADCCDVPSAAHATCYRHQIFRTTDAFVRELNIPAEKYSISYQSRLGRDKWLLPSTEQKLQELAASGVRKLSVICPAFVADCVETLEEIGIRGKEVFLEAGGEEFELIPCINEHPAWIDALAGWVAAFERQGEVVLA